MRFQIWYGGKLRWFRLVDGFTPNIQVECLTGIDFTKAMEARKMRLVPTPPTPRRRLRNYPEPEAANE